MALAALTATQQQTIDGLVATGRLARVPADLVRSANFARQAEDAIADLPCLRKHQNRYNLAYDACHDLGEALLAGYGYRTLNGPGQHEVIGRFRRAVLDCPPGEQEARRFDQLRRARNQQRYDARLVGEAEATLAAQTAVGLLAALTQRGMPL